MSSSPPPTPAKNSKRFRNINTPCEHVEDYLPGGFHPVHLEDLFKHARYKVIRKLGVGSYSTVWLSTDQQSRCFVAMKILDADSSKHANELRILHHLAGRSSSSVGAHHVTPLLDSFRHTGPNGEHLCLVLEPMGPSANSMVDELPCFKPRNGSMKVRYPLWMARRLLRETLKGLVFLHANGITHGDVQPGNILFALGDLGDVPEDALKQDEDCRFGSLSPPIERLDGKEDKWAPKYLAVPQPLDRYTNIGKDFVVKLSDFGGAFFSSEPPAEIITPRGLQPPEMVLGSTYHRSLDIWSFGCLMFEFITGRPLFIVPGFGYDEDEQQDKLLLQMTGILGPLPDHLFVLWPRTGTYFNKDRVLINIFLDGVAPVDTDPLEGQSDPLETFFDNERPQDMNQKEAEVVKALMRRILQYDPEKRPTAEELLQDPWFAN